VHYFTDEHGKRVWMHLHDGEGKPTRKRNPDWPNVSPKGKRIERLLGGIRRAVGGDHTVDLARLLRVPGTLNRKDERNGTTPVPCRLQLSYPERRYPLAAFARFEPVDSPRLAPNGSLSSPVGLPDDDLIQIASHARNGEKFTRLWRGDTDGYPSHSEADAALMALLAFWTGRDEARMEALFSQSGLGQRDKWQSRPDYRAMTISFACEKCSEAYNPGANRAMPHLTNGKWPGSGPDVPEEPPEPLAGTGRQGRSRRPTIIISIAEKVVNDQAIAALAAEPDLYCRGGSLVRVIREPAQSPRIRRHDGSPRIAPVEEPTLSEILSDVARWVKVGDKGKQRPAHPPKWSVKAVACRGAWKGLRYLAGVIEAPALRPDGTLLDKAGYDDATGLLYCPSETFPAIPAAPTIVDAQAAAGVLLDLVREFPFVSAAHRAAWLAGMLTPFARPAIQGPCPMLLLEASVAGSGKTLLAYLIGIIATGRKTSVAELSDDNEEVRKALLTIAVEGDQIVLFDNASGSFGCKALDAAITSCSMRGRILGKTQSSGDVPLNTFFIVTGNNLNIRADTFRRVVPCRLEPACESPEQRDGFAIPDLAGHVERHRAELVVAALTVLRAYFVAGCPQENLPAFGSFEAWSAVVRQAVRWATGQDPCATRSAILPESRGCATLEEVLEGWAELPRGTKGGHTTNEALSILNGALGGYQRLRNALAEWSKGSELPKVGSLSGHLRNNRGRVVGRWRLCGQPDGHDKVTRWRVELVGGHGAGGAGDGGGCFPPFARASSSTRNECGLEDPPPSPASPAGGHEGPSRDPRTPKHG
jgi:hypothetical protein